MARQYGANTAARRTVEAREKRYTAILAVMAEDRRGVDFPNAIASAIEHVHGVEVPHPHGHNGKRLGGGSAISPTLRALEHKGWITNKWHRDDGLSGSAYRITAAGRAELARRQRSDMNTRIVLRPGDRWVSHAIEYAETGRFQHIVRKGGSTSVCSTTTSDPDIWRKQPNKPFCKQCTEKYPTETAKGS
jgi:hypothetical protein